MRAIRRVTAWGLLINLILTAAKFAAGIIGGSRAVVADAVHSTSDMLTDILILVGARYWTAPADVEHPYGHRRIETAITSLLGLALGVVGIGIGYDALATIHDEAPVSAPSWIAFGAAAVSIVSKELLYRWTVGVGRRIRSDAVVANAWHHRSDALSSIPAALAVAGAALLPTWQVLDHVGAVIVAMFIIQAAWAIVAPSVRRLVDVAAPEDLSHKVEAIALSTPDVARVHAVRTRYLGSGLHVDLHVQVAPEMSVQRGHTVSERVKSRLLAEGPDVVDVVVHLEPCGDGPD